MIPFWTILQLIFLSTFWCIGVYMNSDQGDIFYFLRRLAVKAPQWIFKPLIGCVNCMASLHTAVVMLFYNALTGFPAAPWWNFILLWVIVAVITSGLTGLIYSVFMTYVAQKENE